MKLSPAELIRARIEASMAVKAAILHDPELIARIESLAAHCQSSLEQGGRILFAGNGGSFADAQHLAAEFTSRLCFDRAPLAALALGTNGSSISAIGNDYGYEQVFAREVVALGRPGDVFIPITTSGNSPNLLVAVEEARKKQLHVVGFTGQSGGKLFSQCDCIRVPSTVTARIQESHILIGHILCELVERGMFASAL
ncbi:MAG: SIS domain-containing protein [Magnetococcales bacterium]|nr:SIS domain-containing protein [Magnetococcales bacterium]